MYLTLHKLFISDGIKGKHCKQKLVSVLNASMSPEWLKHLCICTYIEIAHSWNMQLSIESSMLCRLTREEISKPFPGIKNFKFFLTLLTLVYIAKKSAFWKKSRFPAFSVSIAVLDGTAHTFVGAFFLNNFSCVPLPTCFWVLLKRVIASGNLACLS